MSQSYTPAATQPITCPMPHAQARTGMSRSAIYRAAANGQIRLLKLGRTTLVDLDSVRAYLDSLPTYVPKSKATNA